MLSHVRHVCQHDSWACTDVFYTCRILTPRSNAQKESICMYIITWPARSSAMGLLDHREEWSPACEALLATVDALFELVVAYIVSTYSQRH